MKRNQITANIKIMMNDDNIHRLPAYVEPTFNDPESSKYVDGIGYHWYENDITNLDRLVTTHNKYPDKFILGTEVKLFKFLIFEF